MRSFFENKHLLCFKACTESRVETLKGISSKMYYAQANFFTDVVTHLRALVQKSARLKLFY